MGEVIAFRPRRRRRRRKGTYRLTYPVCHQGVLQPPDPQIDARWRGPALERGLVVPHAMIPAREAISPAQVALLYEADNAARIRALLDGAPMSDDEYALWRSRWAATAPWKVRQHFLGWAIVHWAAAAGRHPLAVIYRDEARGLARLGPLAHSVAEARARIATLGLVVEERDLRRSLSLADALHYETMKVTCPTQMNVRQHAFERVSIAVRLPQGVPVMTADRCSRCDDRRLVYFVMPSLLVWVCPACGAVDGLEGWDATGWARRERERLPPPSPQR